MRIVGFANSERLIKSKLNVFFFFCGADAMRILRLRIAVDVSYANVNDGWYNTATRNEGINDGSVYNCKFHFVFPLCKTALFRAYAIGRARTPSSSLLGLMAPIGFRWLSRAISRIY